jgi:hypothetical protein
MIYIAHRGLFNGPDVNLENRPEQIERALSRGYNCEIDVWCHDDHWYLGHDHADYKIDYRFLWKSNLWIHAKNLEALTKLGNQLNYFWHESDTYTITSRGYVWTQPGKSLGKKSIMVMPEYIDKTLSNIVDVNCTGICSDYVEKIKDIRDAFSWVR